MEKKQVIVLVTVGALVLAVLIALVAVMTQPQNVIRGEFVPPAFEEKALVGAPEEPLPPQYGTMEVDEGFVFGLTAAPTLNGNDLALCLTSPATNTVWLLVRVYDASGALLGESGLIRPGEYLPALTLTALPEGEELVASVLSYEMQTYYSMGSVRAELRIRSAE